MNPARLVKILANTSFQKSTHDVKRNSINQFICFSFSNPYVPERTCPQRSMRVSVFSLLNGLVVHSPGTILLESGGCQGESRALLLVIGISVSFLKHAPTRIAPSKHNRGQPGRLTWLPVKVCEGWSRSSSTRGRSHPMKSAAIYLAVDLAKRGTVSVVACRWLTRHRFNATMMTPREKAI